MPSFTHPVGEHAPKPPPGVPMNPMPAELAAEKPVPLGKGGGRADLPPATTEFIALDKIHPSPFNPRKEFPQEALQELADSIRERGLQQNLVVRPHPKKPGHYELMGGERRWRALKLLGAEGAMCKLSDATDAESLANQIVENLQRQDVAPIEEAEGFVQLQDQDPQKWTAAAIGRAIGRTDTFVRQRLAIARNLAAPLKKSLAEGKLNVEAARTLAAFPKAMQTSIDNWTIERGPAHIRANLIARCIPESAAKFDVALYTGEWVEGDKGRRFLLDVDQFRKLQLPSAEKKLAEVQKDWPKAKLVEPSEAARLYWADNQNTYYGNCTSTPRDGDTPKKWTVPKDKCTAIVWIAENGEIRKALGVCSGAAIDAAANRRNSSPSRMRSPQGEPTEHKADRIAFNQAVAKAAAKDAAFPLRMFLFNVLAEVFDIDCSRAERDKILPPALVKVADLVYTDKERDVKWWRAVTELTPAQLQSVAFALLRSGCPAWTDYEWREKPGLVVAIAGTLGVTPPAIALPPPPKPAKADLGKVKAELARLEAKAKKVAAKKKHQ